MLNAIERRQAIITEINHTGKVYVKELAYQQPFTFTDAEWLQKFGALVNCIVY